MPLGKVQMQRLAKIVDNNTPDDVGFALLIFPYGETGLTNYISNSRREDMIKALRICADRLEDNSTFDTPTEN